LLTMLEFCIAAAGTIPKTSSLLQRLPSPAIRNNR
jgi:hypothetical protein